ncbi:MAG: rod shape-determining protein MreD [Armatimonadetes bacterium]|nr:rod shape-determining protein MreD [Armatimonadota bacterium]OIP17136.1 MAG: rod shape-determining protein MreD [Comamonadaceae bacterium CG2_30_59_20]PJB44324.1 MAG: rod shape-determining protein MreD [Comamonadaceae bacterium CG_4_9_14_3_um_filter_60_33]
MIMPRGQQLLLPASSLFIWSSLLGALGFNMLVNMGLFGRAAWLPDVLALVLVFWTIHQPQRVGMSAAFLLGLAMDVHQSAVLGQHALAYAVLSFLAIAMHRRLLWFSVPSQAAQVLPLFVVSHALTLLVRLLAGDDFPGWSLLLAPALEALLWPLVSVLLLLPQKRAPDPDANRPL